MMDNLFFFFLSRKKISVKVNVKKELCWIRPQTVKSQNKALKPFSVRILHTAQQIGVAGFEIHIWSGCFLRAVQPHPDVMQNI